jgi:hypothetical protein
MRDTLKSGYPKEIQESYLIKIYAVTRLIHFD